MPNDFNTNDDLLDDELIEAVQTDDAESYEGASGEEAKEETPMLWQEKESTAPPQEVWFAKTSRTNLEKIYLQKHDHVKNPVCSEFEAKLQDGWRLHTMHLASNDMDVFIVLTRG